MAAIERLFKIIIIGDPTVGKTSFVQRYVNDMFRRDYKGTIGVDFALKVVKWSDEETLKLQLWDIAGQERFTSMTRVYYKDAHACIIMFDLSQKNTFHNTLKWKKDLDTKCSLPDGSLVPCILLANKCDLQHREVEQSEIENLCRENEFVGWTEISVKENLMIEESMKFLLEEIMAKCGEMETSLDNKDNDKTIKLKPQGSEDGEETLSIVDSSFGGSRVSLGARKSPTLNILAVPPRATTRPNST